jgi:hypothetical protein
MRSQGTALRKAGFYYCMIREGPAIRRPMPGNTDKGSNLCRGRTSQAARGTSLKGTVPRDSVG